MLKEFQVATEYNVVSVRCPICRKNGSFHGIREIHDAVFHSIERKPNFPTVAHLIVYGLRICPNPECKEPLFVVLGNNRKFLRSYPVERIDFEPTGIPAKILASFEEALVSHSSGCFRAAAIMVRRTLEEICADRGAGGDNLKKRIEALGTKILVPRELLEAADELRILGNDAAHLEAQVYDEVGKDEIEAAIELAKEIIKAVYQLSNLVNRLKALKKP